ncbi:hypothetical protein NA78x_005839 [Anatilimnocola sp. NA78]|uniref:hypothetical protein n=1 Tax=Anatilimnocola sp. NA78 TaxID=3415683 RepID=UPI003CE5C8D2
MKRSFACWQRQLLAMGCLGLGLFLADVASAGHPAYWTIGRHHSAGDVQPLHPQGYAYGWFGASPRPQAARQSGYYGLYRQWSSY